MSVTVILIIVAIITVVLIWRSMMRAREMAVAMAIKTCKKWDAQLLDDTVCLVKMKFSRSEDIGSMCLYREYAFEYSYDGVLRHRAFMQFNGLRFIRTISDDKSILPDALNAPVEKTPKADNLEGGNIIDLNSYRKAANGHKTNEEKKDE